MDLHFNRAEATPAEREAVASVAGPAGPGGGAMDGVGGVDGRRHLLLPALLAVQKAVGWVSPGAVNELGRRLSVPPADVWGVATFYALISTEPGPPATVHLCEDLACRLAGAAEVAAALDRAGTPWRPSPCLGRCDRPSAAFVQHTGTRPDSVFAPAAAATLTSDASGAAAEPVVGPSGEGGRGATAVYAPGGAHLLARVAGGGAMSLDVYREAGGYRALARAVELGPAGTVAEVTASGLSGRGGAGFPTGLKWQAVAAAPVRPHYLVANGDESEPGTFKDRVLMERDPFAVVEAMTVAAFATGCQRGYAYVRGEYGEAAGALERAAAEARGAGLLGADVMGAGFDFDFEVRRGGGAYICGEETALINSIEGRRGEPRNKPPYPTEVGLFGKPTVVNNIETLANVVRVLAEGGPVFAATETRLFSVSGRVARPGLYELGHDVTLAGLLGRAGAASLRAVLVGGAAGTFVRADQTAFALTPAGARAAGAALGSGVVMAFGEGDDLGDAVRRITAFFRDESCGQCVPCRVGTVRQEESLARLAAGAGAAEYTSERALLDDLAAVMRDASICGLGQTAPSALQSALANGLLDAG
ncbi:MAG: NADH-ubiquinone oxidoreductase-F iron-sulfur binding region domain-containing protein [Actinomycetota bacterium]